MKPFSQRWRDASDEAKDQPMEEPNERADRLQAEAENLSEALGQERAMHNVALSKLQAELDVVRKERDRIRDKKWEGIVAIEEQRDAAQALEMWERLPMYLIEHYEGETLTEELLQQATAELLSPTHQASAWMPIETAPKDGVFLVYMPGEREEHRIHAAKFHPNVKIIGGLFAFDRKPATHWQPLPAPPEEKRP